jgi:hypothetical protein
MMRVLAGIAICCAGLIAPGCGSGSGSDSTQEVQQAAERRARVAAERRQALLASEARQAEARERRQAARRQAKREAARSRARRIEAAARRRALAAKRRRAEAAKSQRAEAETSNCDPNYSGACLDPYASDYDCEGGSGDGPEYTGQVTVVGSDPHGLDSDGDGVGCEPY